MEKVSIVIPVYNTASFLQECIESVLQQDYPFFEIILVDDGSTDCSPAICDAYANEYSHIKVVHQKNGGLSDARNVGLSLSTGSYILFLDSDDYYNHSSVISELVTISAQYSADVVCFNFTRSGKSTALKCSKTICSDKAKIVQKGLYTSSACMKLMRLSLLRVNQITFVKGQISEDILFSGKLLSCANLIVFYNIPAYCYRNRVDSITHNITRKTITDTLNIINELSHWCDPALRSYTAFQYATLLVNIWRVDSPLPAEILDSVFKWKHLLSFGADSRVRLIYFFSRIFGIKFTSKILAQYYSIQSKLLH